MVTLSEWTTKAITLTLAVFLLTFHVTQTQWTLDYLWVEALGADKEGSCWPNSRLLTTDHEGLVLPVCRAVGLCVCWVGGPRLPLLDSPPEASFGITAGIAHPVGRVLNLRAPPLTRLIFPCWADRMWRRSEEDWALVFLTHFLEVRAARWILTWSKPKQCDLRQGEGCRDESPKHQIFPDDK